MTGSGLVLAGGGITGIAWELGVLAGLAEAGVDLTDATRIVGTSAGSIVGAQITSGVDLETLYARQLEPPSSEKPAHLGRREQLAYGRAMLFSRGDPTGIGRRIGAFAIEAAAHGRTPSLEERLTVIESRLPKSEWPDRDLRVTVVDAHTGKVRLITRADGVPLRDAVAASCAVPGVYPPVPIDGHTYIDGGSRIETHVGRAAGCNPVVVLAPFTGPVGHPRKQLDALRVPSVLITPDSAAQHAIGSNVLDPARRAVSAEAGRAQGKLVVDQVGAVWR